MNTGALPVFPNNVGGQQLQQLPVLLDHVQLIGIFRGRCSHAGEPCLETRRLHASQLGQGAAEMQEARVRALLSWGQSERRRSVKGGGGVYALTTGNLWFSCGFPASDFLFFCFSCKETPIIGEVCVCFKQTLM